MEYELHERHVAKLAAMNREVQEIQARQRLYLEAVIIERGLTGEWTYDAARGVLRQDGGTNGVVEPQPAE